MKILTRYIIKEIFGPFLFGIFAFTSMFSGFLFIDLLRDTEKYHFSAMFILKLILLRIPEYVINAAPIAVLLAALMGLGKLTSHSETIAMRAGGLSYVKLATPVLAVGLLVTTGCLLMNEYLVPYAMRTYDNMKAEAVSKEAVSTIYHFSRDFYDNDRLAKRVYAERYEPSSKELHQVNIEEFSNGKTTRLIEASVMFWNNGGWFFEKGLIYQFLTDSYYSIIVDKGRVRYSLNLTPTEIERFEEEPEKKSISEFSEYIDKFFPKGKEKNIQRERLLVDLHLKLVIPFACLVFALLGTPLALQPQRRSNAAGFGLCIIFIILWYALMGVGTHLARAGSVPAFLGAWLPNLALTGYGIYVFAKVKS